MTLTPRGTVSNQPLQLQIKPAVVLDAQDRPISGDTVLTLGKGGITLSRVAGTGTATSTRAGVAAKAFDALVLGDRLPSLRQAIGRANRN